MADKPVAVLKLSGEVLSGISTETHKPWIYNRNASDFIAREISSNRENHGIVGILGGGNILRGSRVVRELDIDQTVADDMGMLATVINAIGFKNILKRHYGVPTRVMTAMEIRSVAEPFYRERALRHLEKGRVVLIACGIGRSDFTTDTAMVQYAHELQAKILLKGTKVDGIYDRDPVKDRGNAQKLNRVSYQEYLNRGLEIVDKTAVTQADKHGFTIKVFDIFKEGNLKRILAGENIGSVISA